MEILKRLFGQGDERQPWEVPTEDQKYFFSGPDSSWVMGAAEAQNAAVNEVMRKVVVTGMVLIRAVLEGERVLFESDEGVFYSLSVDFNASQADAWERWKEVFGGGEESVGEGEYEEYVFVFPGAVIDELREMANVYRMTDTQMLGKVMATGRMVVQGILDGRAVILEKENGERIALTVNFETDESV